MVTGIFRIKGHICFPPSDANIENSSCASVPFECQKNAILFVRRLTVLKLLHYVPNEKGQLAIF